MLEGGLGLQARKELESLLVFCQPRLPGREHGPRESALIAVQLSDC